MKNDFADFIVKTVPFITTNFILILYLILAITVTIIKGWKRGITLTQGLVAERIIGSLLSIKIAPALLLRYGYLDSLLMMFGISGVVGCLTVLLYDAVKIDFFSFEEKKKNKEKWKVGWAAFIWTRNPGISVICFREGHFKYNGFDNKKSWFILIKATIIANAAYISLLEGLLLLWERLKDISQNGT